MGVAGRELLDRLFGNLDRTSSSAGGGANDAMIQAIETVDTKGNITRHAAGRGFMVRCGRGGTAGVNHATPTIPSALKNIHCGRCRRLVAHDRRKLRVMPFRRRMPRIML